MLNHPDDDVLVASAFADEWMEKEATRRPTPPEGETE